MEDMKRKAKMDVLKELHKTAREMMKKNMGDIKKVSVAAPDEEGLEDGLDAAKDMLSHQDPDDESSEEPQSMELSPDEHEEDCSPEEIDEKIARLQEMKSRLLGKE